MESCDAMVVGAGPAGSTCARQLRRAGFDVILIDKATFPRDKVCAGWITPAVVEALELDLDDYRSERVLQPMTGFKVGLIDATQQDVRYPAVVSYGIRRVEFDDYLMRRSGVRRMLGESVRSIERRGGRWVVNEAVETPLLIGAGGHFCPVSRHLGARLGRSETVVVAKETEFRLTPAQLADSTVDPEIPELFFCRDLKGYGWCLRKGYHMNVGLGREDSNHLARHLDEFRAFLQASGKLPAELPESFHGHSYGLYGHNPRPLFDDGVLIVGDSAGLAAEYSGEGIRPAVESALLAAEVACAAAGDYRRDRLRPYGERLADSLGQPTAPPAVGPVAEALRGAVGRVLLNSLWFDRHIVLDRWFLHGAYRKRSVH